MSQLILEIERVREIMGLGVESKPIILEQVGVLYKIFQSADITLKNVEDNKVLIKQLDNLKPKGVARLTASEIDELAQLLSNEADSIARAMAGTGFEGATRLSSAKKLDDLLKLTKREETNSLLNLYITKQLTKIYDNSAGYWNKSYVRAANEVRNEIIEFAEAGIITTEDDLINGFKSKLKNEIQRADDSFKWTDYPDFESWAMKKFNQKGGTLDNIIEDFQPYVKKSANRDATFKSTSVGTETRLTDIDQLKLTNFRLLQGFRLKLKNLFKKTPALDTFEKNVALLKGLSLDQALITVNGKAIPKNEFIALVRNIGFDIEQIATLEKNTLVRWQELMKEIKELSPDLAKGMEEVPIFKEVGNGYIWQEEKLSQFIDRLKLRFETPMKKQGGLWGEILLELQEIKRVITLSKKSILMSTSNTIKGVGEFIKGIVSRRFLSAGIYGLPISPKQLGLLLNTRGFNKPFWRSLIESWILLQVWENIISSVLAVLSPILEMLCNKVATKLKWQTNCSDDMRSLKQVWKESLMSIWLDGYNYIDLPISEGFIIKGLKFFSEEVINDPISTGLKLVEDADKYTQQFWSSLPKKTQKKLLSVAAEENSSVFQNFSQVTSSNRDLAFFNNKFLEKNNITSEQSQKLYDARVLTAPETTLAKISAKEAENLLSNRKYEKIENYLKVGGVKDKSGVVYTLKKGDDIYSWKFVPPSKVIRFGVQPIGNNDAFYIYRDDSDKEVLRLTKEDLKKEGFHEGYDDEGIFKLKQDAKKVKDNLQERYPSKPQTPISIEELLKKL